MYRINLSKFDDFISGNNAGVISQASSIKRNSVLGLSAGGGGGGQPEGWGGLRRQRRRGREARGTRMGREKMYKYDEKSRQGKAGFGYYISIANARAHCARHREKKRNISATKPIILQARKFVSLFFMMPLKYINM